jgi:hypothetical protein
MYLLVITLSLFFFFNYRLVTRLSSHEIARRQEGLYNSDALQMMNNYEYFNHDGFILSQEDAEELAVRLRVDKSIITFNAERLRAMSCYFMALHELFRRNILEQRDIALKEPTLNSKQMAMALEFYLQIDGKSFSRMCILFSISYILLIFSGYILYENMLVSWS